MKKRITFISDTHGMHKLLELPGGDILIHAGDFMTSGRDFSNLRDFINWIDNQDYELVICIAGNHDRIFESTPELAAELIDNSGIIYLQDSYTPDYLELPFKVWGSPWQPEFHNWAFNLPRGGDELQKKWNLIPEDTDILITHGPPQEILDTSGEPYNKPLLGCELLKDRVLTVKPKIHVFGHIHGSHGYKYLNGTHFINASVLNEQYELVNDGITVDWNLETNEFDFLT